MTDETKLADPLGNPQDDFVEVVAVPAPNVTAPDKMKHNGTVYPGARDADGCMRYRVPKDYAASLVNPSGGMRFVLCGGADELRYKAREGLYVVDKVAVRHTKRTTSKGKVIWEPVKIEDPNVTEPEEA
jgi:hypothetical protein